MLTNSRVEANVPASDLSRAREFYRDKLGLTPTHEYEDVFLTYRTEGGTSFNSYQTSYAGQALHTVAQWHVDDVEAEVEELKRKGVEFEVYPDMPGVAWNGEVASLEGMGLAAWFRDSEGNIRRVGSGLPAL